MECESGEEAKDKASKIGHREMVKDSESYVKDVWASFCRWGRAPEKFSKRELK